jgi:phosphoglycolate phosphatase-like HAD superfamily hydrolase
MIGDTPYDTKAAAALGVASIGLLSGGFDKKTLLEAGATDVVDGIASLAALLGRDRLAAR